MDAAAVIVESSDFWVCGAIGSHGSFRNCMLGVRVPSHLPEKEKEYVQTE